MRFADLTLPELKALLPTLSDADVSRMKWDKRQGVKAAARVEEKRREDERTENARVAGMLSYEEPLWAQGITHIAGTDEVGAGPLAGPVVAAAVILPPGTSIARINDSKLLDEPTRNELAQEIRARAIAFHIAACTVDEIDALNIFHASCEAMRRAILALTPAPQHVLIDAKALKKLPLPQTSIIKGDQKSQSIAAAAILAKVERDRMMNELALAHPGYGFESHKGYATPEHLAALTKLGASPIHRRSYAPVKTALGLDVPPPEQLGLF